MSPPLNLTLIYGSVRDGRRCDVVAGWAAAEVARHGRFALDTVDPRDGEIARALEGEGAALAALRARFGVADAFLLVVPEYNHSYPAPLKAVIDAAGREWQAKPVAFVSYGGLSGGLRAVEHLRNVVTELHATGIRDGVSFANVWEAFDDTGAPVDAAGAGAAMTVLLNRLVWWAAALRTARAAHPYGERAA